MEPCSGSRSPSSPTCTSGTRWCSRVWAAAVSRLKPIQRVTVQDDATDRTGRLRPAQDDRPGVSVIIAARNEAAAAAGTNRQHPRERLPEGRAADHRRLRWIRRTRRPRRSRPTGTQVTLLHLPPAGKAGALNAAVREAKHPLLVFADARQRFAPDAIRRLVSHFDDPAIGAVSGELMLDRPAPRPIGDGVGAYWTYEKWLRRREAIVGSTLGVTGAIYAMRRWLWRPLAGRHDPRRRHGADARGARRVPRDVRRPGARVRRDRAGCVRRAAAQVAHARRQLPAARARAAPARPDRQPGLAAVRVAQGRTSAGPVRARRACWRRARGWRRRRCSTPWRSPLSSASTGWRRTARCSTAAVKRRTGQGARGDS